MVKGVGDYARDFIIDVARRSSMATRRNVQVLADGIVTGEVSPDKLTAHNQLVRSSNTFVVGKGPAIHKRNPEDTELAWIGRAHRRIGQVFARLKRRMLLQTPAGPEKLTTDWAEGSDKIFLRRCPICDRDSIIGHGCRRKQAHDEDHDWI